MRREVFIVCQDVIQSSSQDGHQKLNRGYDKIERTESKVDKMLQGETRDYFQLN